MSFLTNGPKCEFDGEHKGKVHAYVAQRFADLKGNPVQNEPKQEFLICEGHYPDADDPTFSTCTCRLCLERQRKLHSN